MAKKHSFLKGLLVFVIVVVVICGAIYGALYFTTPATFGLQDTVIGNISFKEAGMDNMRFTDIIGMGMSLTQPQKKEEIIDSNTSATAKDFESVERKINGDIKQPDGSAGKKIDTKTLKNKPAVFGEEKKIEFSANELAALLNLALSGSPISTVAGDMALESLENSQTSNFVNLELYIPKIDRELIYQIFEQFSVRVESVSISVVDGNIFLTTVYSLILPKDFMVEINKLPVKILDKVFITSRNLVKIEDGKLIPIASAENAVIINQMKQNQSCSLLAILFKNIGIEGVIVEKILEDTNAAIGYAVTTVFNNIGKINGLSENGLVFTTRVK